MKSKTIAFVNEKGGVGKTTSAVSTAYTLAQRGEKVLLIDFDGQAHSSMLCGVEQPNLITTNIASLMGNLILETPLPNPETYILHHNGVDLIPSNSDLFALERNLCNAAFREKKLKELLDPLLPVYDRILIDCMPRIGAPMMNVLMCADSLVIPTQAEVLSTCGLDELMRHYASIRRNTDHNLRIEGILLTMYDKRTRLSREITSMLEEYCQGSVRIFDTRIPRSSKVGEAALYGQNICEYMPKNPAACAYKKFVEELLDCE